MKILVVDEGKQQRGPVTKAREGEACWTRMLLKSDSLSLICVSLVPSSAAPMDYLTGLPGAHPIAQRVWKHLRIQLQNYKKKKKRHNTTTKSRMQMSTKRGKVTRE